MNTISPPLELEPSETLLSQCHEKEKHSIQSNSDQYPIQTRNNPYVMGMLEVYDKQILSTQGEIRQLEQDLFTKTGTLYQKREEKTLLEIQIKISRESLEEKGIMRVVEILARGTEKITLLAKVEDEISTLLIHQKIYTRFLEQMRENLTKLKEEKSNLIKKEVTKKRKVRDRSMEYPFLDANECDEW